MPELTDEQKIHYFDTLVKTLATIRELASKPVFGEQLTMRFIYRTANDTLYAIQYTGENSDTQRNATDPVD